MILSKRAKWIILRASAVLAVALVLLYSLDLGRIVDYFSRDLLLAILACQPVVLLSLLFITLRYRILLGEHKASRSNICKASVLSLGLGVIMPVRGAEFFKPIYLKRHENVPISAGLSSLILERMMDLIIIGFMTILSVSLIFAGEKHYIFIGLMLVSISILALLPLLEKMMLRVAENLPWQAAQRFSRKFINHTVTNIRLDTLYKALILGVGAWGCSYLSFCVFMYVSGVENIGVIAAFAVFVASTIGGSLPALPAGLGTYEAAAVIVLMNFGRSMEESIAIAVSLHASQLAMLVVISFVILLKEELGVSSLVRELKELAS